jgi:hypothetical protein
MVLGGCADPDQSRKDRNPTRPASRGWLYALSAWLSEAKAQGVRLAVFTGMVLVILSMKPRPLLSDLSAEQLFVRAHEYRTMASTARTAVVMASLKRLADHFEEMAARRSDAMDGGNR